jgi:hypothetical protein
VKKFLRLFAASVLGFAVVLGTTVAIAQFDAVTYSISADAGIFGNVTILGACTGPGCGSSGGGGNISANYAFIDGGDITSLAVKNVNVTGIVTVAGAGITSTAATPLDLAVNNNAVTVLTADAAATKITMFLQTKFNANPYLVGTALCLDTGCDTYINGTSGAAFVHGDFTADGELYAKAMDAGTLVAGHATVSGTLVSDAGNFGLLVTQNFGAQGTTNIGSGGPITGLEYGSCAASLGTCNAAVFGATGTSLCVCDIQGGNWAIDAGAFTCHARADAGSATVWVNANATPIPGNPVIGIQCEN